MKSKNKKTKSHHKNKKYEKPPLHQKIEKNTKEEESPVQEKLAINQLLKISELESPDLRTQEYFHGWTEISPPDPRFDIEHIASQFVTCRPNILASSTCVNSFIPENKEIPQPQIVKKKVFKMRKIRPSSANLNASTQTNSKVSKSSRNTPRHLKKEQSVDSKENLPKERIRVNDSFLSEKNLKRPPPVPTQLQPTLNEKELLELYKTRTILPVKAVNLEMRKNGSTFTILKEAIPNNIRPLKERKRSLKVNVEESQLMRQAILDMYGKNKENISNNTSMNKLEIAHNFKTRNEENLKNESQTNSKKMIKEALDYISQHSNKSFQFTRLDPKFSADWKAKIPIKVNKKDLRFDLYVPYKNKKGRPPIYNFGKKTEMNSSMIYRHPDNSLL